MFFKCNCGTVVHLSQNRQNIIETVNPMCFDCFIKTKPKSYNIEYEIAPLRAIYSMNVFAKSEELAIEILRQFKNDVELNIRKVTLI